MTGRAHLVLYVADQRRSAEFWQSVLEQRPSLDEPGMTEFALNDGAVLGLMPARSIAALLPTLPDPGADAGVPRCELYLHVGDPGAHHARALAAGATELSPLARRDWGDDVAYSLEPDGHVVAFAATPDVMPAG